MTTPFTHTFEISFDDTQIQGEAEFNSDGVASYSFEGSPTITIRNGQLITELFTILQELYKLNGGLTKIEVSEK